MEGLGGGIFASPTHVDVSQGELEPTGNNLDVAIEGKGFFSVREPGGQTRLTRDGRFSLDKTGQLILANGTGQTVLDAKGNLIRLDPSLANAQTSIGRFGEITQGGRLVATVGLSDVTDPSKLKKLGGNLFSHPEADTLRPSASVLHSGSVERANVEPATELTHLMDAQRQLEANANMIRYQDQTLARLVNDVGKIS